MGLDISVYEKAELTDPHEQTDECWDNGHQWAFCYDGMEQSLRGLVPERCYYTRGGKYFGFRAGSYGGYNQWREALSLAALGVAPELVWQHPDDYRDKPFYELVNFADNEGTIGPEAAQDLYQDFVDQESKILAFWADNFDQNTREWFEQKYDDWIKAFDLARGTGLVAFH